MSSFLLLIGLVLGSILLLFPPLTTAFTVKLPGYDETFGERRVGTWNQKNKKRIPMGNDDIPVPYGIVNSRTDVDIDEKNIENSAVDNFLIKYGYLKRHIDVPVTDEERRIAVKKFQEFVHLRMTGIVDEKTKAKMFMPRCGLSDPTDTFELANFETVNDKWSRKTLAYKITKYSKKIDKKIVDEVVDKAMEMWSSASGLTLQKANTNAFELNISFVSKDHDDGSPFDGNGGVLGHAFYPEIGEIHLDDDEKFTVQSKDGINLLFVVLHELGHALGLAHSSNIDAIMGPFYMGYEPNLKLSADDIAGIQFLYGKPTVPLTTQPPTTQPPTTPPTTTSAPTTPPPTTPAPATPAPTRGPSATVQPTTKPSQPKDKRVFLCNFPYKGGMSIHNNTYGFHRKLIDIFSADGQIVGRTSVDNMFSFPINVQAAAYNEITKQTFLFNDRYVYRFTQNKLDTGFPKKLEYSIQSAVVVDDLLIAFSFNHIHYLDQNTMDDYVDGQITISEAYPGVLIPIKTVLTYGDGVVYILSRKVIFKMDMYSGEIKKVACDQTENIEERDWKCQGTFDCLKQKEQ